GKKPGDQAADEGVSSAERLLDFDRVDLGIERSVRRDGNGAALTALEYGKAAAAADHRRGCRKRIGVAAGNDGKLLVVTNDGIRTPRRIGVDGGRLFHGGPGIGAMIDVKNHEGS